MKRILYITKRKKEKQTNKYCIRYKIQTSGEMYFLDILLNGQYHNSPVDYKRVYSNLYDDVLLRYIA
jgi:hypothetical protein